MKQTTPLQWLRSFEAAARLSSFSQAAEELLMTQAAISKQIKALEHHLKCQLFARHAHGVSLTPQGRRYWLDTQEHIHSLDKVTAQMFSPRQTQLLRIRCNISYGVLVLSRVLEGFKQQYPDLQIELVHNIWKTNHSNNDADIEICYREIGPQLEGVHLLHQDILFPVVAADLPDDAIADLPLIHVLGYYRGWTWWLEQATSLDKDTLPELTQDWINHRTNHPPLNQKDWRMDNSLSAYEFAAQGLGIALGRTCLVQHVLDSGRLRRLDLSTEFAALEGFHISVTPKGVGNEASHWFWDYFNHKQQAGT